MVKRSSVEFKPAYRIIPSCYPSIYLFEDVADPADFDALYALEALTNPRLSDIGNMALLPKEEWVLGEGSTPIMATFTHIKPEGDRFTDGTFGAFYASDSLECATYETAFHRAAYYASVNEPPCELEMRVYTVEISGSFVDIRDMAKYSDYYSFDAYPKSQVFGRTQKDAGEYGIVYYSVRYTGGTNVAVFRPKGIIKRCSESKYLKYKWDGKQIKEVYEISGARIINYKSCRH